MDNDMQPFPKVGQYSISITSEPYSLPNDVQLVGIASGGLNFNWTSVDPACSAISYKVSAIDCGDCPNTTNSSTIVCSGVRLSGETQMCTLSVQSVVCGNITSNFSDPLNVSLLAANISRASILPRYWQNTSNLAVLVMEIPIVRYSPSPLNITNHELDHANSISGISVTVNSYTVDYFNPITGESCGPMAIHNLSSESIINDSNLSKVRSELSVPDSCGNDDIDVIISVMSVLGTGPTQILRIGGTNKFVNITFDTMTNSISCTFLNQQDNSDKSCNVSYAPCGNWLKQNVAVGYSTIEQPNIVELKLTLPESTTYCYVVAASNDTFRVLIEGRIVKRGGKGPVDGLSSGIVVGIVLGVVFILMFIVGILGLIVYITRKGYKGKLKLRPNVDCEKSSATVELTNQTDAKKCATENDYTPLPTSNIESTLPTEETAKSTLSHSEGATENKEFEDSDQNQTLESTTKAVKTDDNAQCHDDQQGQAKQNIDSNVSEVAINNTLGSDETIENSHGIGHKNEFQMDQGSDQAPELVTSSVDPDTSHAEGSTNSNNKNACVSDEQASSNSYNIKMLSKDDDEWVRDEDAPNCMYCDTKFGGRLSIERRHHCRKCGKVVCGICSKEKFPLPNPSSKEVRVCNICYKTLTAVHGSNH